MLVRLHLPPSREELEARYLVALMKQDARIWRQRSRSTEATAEDDEANNNKGGTRTGTRQR